MFILRDLLTPLQQQFSTTTQGQRRAVWFVYTLLAVVVPFISSMTSNLLRALHTLFGLPIQRQGQSVCFASKMEQAATMLKGVFDHFQQPLLAVTDSWFGNDGLWSRLDRDRGGDFHLLSRLRTNIILYDLIAPLATGEKRPRGRPRKYGERLGSVKECAPRRRQQVQTYSVFLYGKQREVQAYAQVVMLKR